MNNGHQNTDSGSSMSDAELEATAGSTAPDDLGSTDDAPGLTAGGTGTSVGQGVSDSGGGATPRGYGGSGTTGGESSGSIGGGTAEGTDGG